MLHTSPLYSHTHIYHYTPLRLHTVVSCGLVATPYIGRTVVRYLRKDSLDSLPLCLTRGKGRLQQDGLQCEYFPFFISFQLCVQENYRNNPFHNFRHCFCVTQMMYGMINLCKLMDFLNKEELGILLTACICHDLDHPGYNNT